MSTLAERQLAAWQQIAESWDLEETPTVLRCAACHKSVLLLRDRHKHRFMYTPGERLALIVLHLRNFHSELDPDRPLPAL